MGLLQLAERVLAQRDRLQRLQHLGELSLEQLGLAGGVRSWEGDGQWGSSLGFRTLGEGRACVRTRE